MAEGNGQFGSALGMIETKGWVALVEATDAMTKAANVEMILPWQWFERCARRMLGDEALIGGAYRHEVLRWRLLQVLSTSNAAEVRAYLAGEDAARRGFQLAEHLALADGH